LRWQWRLGGKLYAFDFDLRRAAIYFYPWFQYALRVFEAELGFEVISIKRWNSSYLIKYLLLFHHLVIYY
jgi:hypothetical protein